MEQNTNIFDQLSYSLKRLEHAVNRMVNNFSYVKVIKVLTQIKPIIHEKDFEKDVETFFPINVQPFTKTQMAFLIGCCFANLQWVQEHYSSIHIDAHREEGLNAICFGMFHFQTPWHRVRSVIHYFLTQTPHHSENMLNYLLKQFCRCRVSEGIFELHGEFSQLYQLDWKMAFKQLLSNGDHKLLPLIQWMWSNCSECWDLDDDDKYQLMYEVLYSSKDPYLLAFLIHTVHCPHNILLDYFEEHEMDVLFHAGVDPLLFPDLGEEFMHRQLEVEKMFTNIFPKDIIQQILLPYCGF